MDFINNLKLKFETDNSKIKADSDSVSLYDILLCFIGIASIVSMLLLCVNSFDIPVMLSVSACITFILAFFIKKINIIDLRFCSIIFVCIILFAMVFRSGSFTHYQGGQDQGLYVNMSETIVRDKSIDFYDSFGASLPDNELLRNNYKAALMGASASDKGDNLYQIDFYPLNAVWMAVSKALFGLGQHGLAIQFFSLLTVIGVYLLTLELTEYKYKTAYIAGLLTALNPALVFFSKFPVSETLSMAFCMNGFYFLLRAVKCGKKSNGIFYFATSAVLLGMFNFVRMSFVLYLPTIVIIFVIPFILSKYKHLQKPVFGYTVTIIGLFSCSWLWYYFYQPTLFKPMFDRVFSKYLYIIIPALCIFILVFIFIFFYTKKNEGKVDKFANKAVNIAEHLAPFLLVFVLALSVFRVYEICTMGVQNYLNEGNAFNFKYTSIYTLIQLISPFLFIVLLMIPFLKIKFNRVQTLLIITASVIWAAILLDRWFIPYVYYYSRYVASDMLLISIMIVSIALTDMLNRKEVIKQFTVIIISLSVVYSCIFSGIQIGRAETDITDFFTEIDEIVKQDDVLISFAGYAVNTPIKYYFNKPLYQLDEGNSLDNIDIINTFYAYSQNNIYSDVYILTAADYSKNLQEYGLEYIDEYEYKYSYFDDSKHGVPRDNVQFTSIRAFLLPFQYGDQVNKFYLYKLIDKFNALPHVSKVMPDEVNETITTTGLYDHFTFSKEKSIRNADGYLTSISDEENYLLYGPYQKALAGTYNLKYMLELPEGESGILLAKTVIKAKRGQEVFAIYDVYRGDENPFVIAELPEDYEDIEISLLTYVSGVVFKGYEITKIS